jgi:hypothetical protein
MARMKTLHGGIQHADNAGAEQRWVEIFADHVRRRFNSRALVTVRIDSEEPVELAYVYAIEGGGLVLTLPSERKEDLGHGNHGHGNLGHAHDGGHDEADDSLLNGDLGTGQSEIWIGSPAQAIFHVRRAEQGALCTGFGYLGLSRTPRLFIPRGTEPPAPPDPHAHDEF